MFFVLTGIMTTAGKAMIDSAKASSGSLTVDRISFGDSAATLTASTSTIGNLLETAEYPMQSVNLLQTRMEFQCLLKGQAADKLGTLGVYIGTTLIATARLTVPNNAAGFTQVSVRLDYANASVFAKTSSTVPASLLAEVHAKALTDSYRYLDDGAVSGNKAFFGIAGGKEAGLFCGFVNIIADQAEFTSTIAAGAPNGTTAYYLQDLKKYVVTNGAWTLSTGVISDEVRAGRLYRSEITKSIYFARSATDFLRVYKEWDMSADITLSLTGTTVSKLVSLQCNALQIDCFFDNAPTPQRISRTVDVKVPVGAARMYIRLVQSSVASHSALGIIYNDVVESVLDWTTFNLSKLFFTGCTELVNVPGTFLPPSIKTFADMFSGCSKFAPQLLQWNTASITDFSNCFKDCVKFACSLPWDTSSGVVFTSMFEGCSVFNSGINGFNLRKGGEFSNMLKNCVVFNQPIDQLRPGADADVTGVIYSGMFYNCKALNRNIVGWGSQKIYAMDYMFYGASAFNQNLSSWTILFDVNTSNYDTGATAWVSNYKPRFI